LTSYDSNSEY